MQIVESTNCAPFDQFEDDNSFLAFDASTIVCQPYSQQTQTSDYIMDNVCHSDSHQVKFYTKLNEFVLFVVDLRVFIT